MKYAEFMFFRAGSDYYSVRRKIFIYHRICTVFIHCIRGGCMNKLLTFSFIGGDLRQIRTASMLAADGYHIRIFGLENNDVSNMGNIKRSATLSECLENADVVVLPLPYSATGGEYINTPLSNVEIETARLTDILDADTLVFAGKIDDALRRRCANRNLKIFDYAEREEFAVMNAVPTAEGAIEIAMKNTPYTIKDSKCLVIGYGRIGKILSSDLSGLGARVCVSARKYSDFAWISARGFDSVSTGNVADTIGEFDLIFNTVPSAILDFRVLSATKSDVLIIDLASRPGGVDFETAKELNRRTIWALSLPGKVAPDTAGKIIKDTLINILEESGV